MRIPHLQGYKMRSTIILMSTPEDMNKIIGQYYSRKHSPEIEVDDLIKFTKSYAERADDDNFEDLLMRTRDTVLSHLIQLENRREFILEYNEGVPDKVYPKKIYMDLLHEEYQKLQQQPDRPFPIPEGLKHPFPPRLTAEINIKSDFVDWIDKGKTEPEIPVIIHFPEGINSLIVRSGDIPGKLLDLSVQKIKQYLRQGRNASYMQQKLVSIFRQKAVTAKNLIKSIITTSREVMHTILEPTDFTFHFWTQLSSLVIKDYADKRDKLSEEHSYIQAAYFIGFYCVHFRAKVQREKDVEASLKNLEQNLRKKPFAFTLTDIYGFKDSRGNLLTRKYTKKNLHTFLEKKTKSEDRELPELIRLRAPNKAEYFIYKDLYIKLLLDKIDRAKTYYQRELLNKWVDFLKEEKKVPEMKDDNKFIDYVDSIVTREDPLLKGLLNYSILYLLGKEVNIQGPAKDDYENLFESGKKSLVPVHKILDLDRKKLLSEAKMHVPFWQTVPVLHQIVLFFKSLFTPPTQKKTKKKAKGAPEAKTGAKYFGDAPVKDYSIPASGTHSKPGSEGATYNEALRELKDEFLEGEADINTALKGLIEEWNPLIDPAAKQNLVEDVNSFIRDFMRRVRSGFRFNLPRPQRIHEMANRLVMNEAFNEIRRKDRLKRYIELYILKLLEKK
jgi:hypothetical protein